MQSEDDPDHHYLAVFRCSRPDHQHSYVLRPGRSSIGTLSSSNIRIHDDDRLISFGDIEFSGAIIWIRSTSSSDPIRVLPSLKGSASCIPVDGKYYQILSGNIVDIAGCRFRIDLQKEQLTNQMENTQILDSLQLQDLSDTEMAVQPSSDLAPSLEFSKQPCPNAPSISVAVSGRGCSEMEAIRESPPLTSAEKAGFSSPLPSRLLPVLATPLKDGPEVLAATVLNQEASNPALSSHDANSDASRSPIADGSPSLCANDIQRTNLLPDQKQVVSARDTNTVVTAASASTVAAPAAVVASLSSPVLSRRRSIDAAQEVNTVVSPPLGSSEDQYEALGSPAPLPDPAPQPHTTSILHSKSLGAMTPLSTRNRVATTPGSALSSSRRRRRVGLSTPRPMPKLSGKELGSDSSENGAAAPEEAAEERTEVADSSLDVNRPMVKAEVVQKPDVGDSDRHDFVQSVLSKRARKLSVQDPVERLASPRKNMNAIERKSKPKRVEFCDELSADVKAGWKPVVMFTGIANDDLLKIVSDLGGSCTEQFGKADVLVCDNKIRRTVKFMCGIATAKAIVTDKWLADSQKASQFIDTDRYIIDDKATERQFGFRLADSICAENRQVLLRGKSFWISPNCNPKPLDFTPIIECSGGSVVDADISDLAADVFLISMFSLEDENRRYSELGREVFDKELVLTSILRQSFETEEFRISINPSPPKSKRRKR